jgi:rhodanese-related sulfurtransferase
VHGPKGIGVLVVRKNAAYHPIFVGGGQEQGRRAGTEPLPALAGLAEVLGLLVAARAGSSPKHRETDEFATAEQLKTRNGLLRQALAEALPGFSSNARAEACIPTTIAFSVHGMSSAEIWLLLESSGVFVSSGSACQSSKPGYSHVLEAMGCEHWRLASATRLSFGLGTPEGDVLRGCELVRSAGAALRSSYASCGRLMRVSNGVSSALFLVDTITESFVFIGSSAAFSMRVEEFSASRKGALRLDLGRSKGVTGGSEQTLGEQYHFGDLPLEQLGSSASRNTCGTTPLSHPNDWVVDAVQAGVLRVRRGDLSGAPDLFVFASTEVVATALELGLTNQEVALGFVCQDQKPHPAAGMPFVMKGQKAHFAEDLGIDSLVDPSMSLADVRRFDLPVRWIDVRECYERGPLSPFAAATDLLGHEVGARHSFEHVPLSGFTEFLLHEMHLSNPKETVFVFLCRSGLRAARAARLMRLLGWSRSWSLCGGAAAVQMSAKKSV